MIRVLTILSPFGAILCGMLLRLFFIDTIPEDAKTFILENYFRSVWIDFIIASGALIGGPIIYGAIQLNQNQRLYLVLLFVAVLFACIFFVDTMPKFGDNSHFYTIWIPMIFSSLLLVVIGWMLTKKT